jgi:uncharacterized protein (TIGR02466 family)
MAAYTFNPEQHLRWFFPTPVVATPWPDSDALNAELRTVILDAEAAAEPAFQNVIGGWATTKDFFAWDFPCIRELAGHIEELLASVVAATTQGANVPAMSHFSLQSWANVLRSGGYHAPHAHPNCFWSGAYYVSVGRPDGGAPFNGQIELFDPRSASDGTIIPGSTFHSKCRLSPEPGMAILFPSWIRHMVHPFHGEGERISVAFNLVRR